MSVIATALREDFNLSAAPSVTEFCEHLTLPAKMAPAAPGPFSLRRRPIMRPILECGHPQSGVRKCFTTGGAQVLKTTGNVLIVAYRIPHSPMPTLILGPAENWLGTEISEKRLKALIDENAILRAYKPFDHHKFKTLSMDMSGGFITFEGAGSSTSTSGSTQGIVYICEAAKIEHHDSEQSPEAHPIKLAFERTNEYRGLDLHLMDFTPNTPHHLAWEMWQACTQTHFHVPCPHCQVDPFPLEFEEKAKGDDLETILEESQQHARPDHYRSLIWSPDARRADGSWDIARIHETARYVCPNGCHITDQDKPGMIDRYVEVHHNKNAPLTDRSFRIPSLYAPKVTFGHAIEKFLTRGKNESVSTGLQNFHNSFLGLPWSPTVASVKEQHVLQIKCEDYARLVIPTKPAFLMLTADPGERATHWGVTAVFPNSEMLLIDWGIVTGPEEMLRPEWLRQRSYLIAGTIDQRMPDLGYIDSGWATNRIYDICEASRLFFTPTKGDTRAWGEWKMTQATSRPHLRLITYSDTQLKDELYARLIYRRREPRIHLPGDVTSDVIMGLAGQEKDRRTGKWKELPADHYGDVMKLAVLGRQVGRTLLQTLRR
jgi:phage terminase large subunit GpA-like protein